MTIMTRAALLAAAILMSAPAFADDGSGRPVPGLGPGGAGATNPAPDDPGYEPIDRGNLSTVARYRASQRDWLQRYGSGAGNRPAE